MIDYYMQVNVTVPKDKVMPIANRYAIQGLIYEILKRGNPSYGQFLHQEGYKLPSDERRYKLFTFTSLLGGKIDKTKGVISYPSGYACFFVASPVKDFVDAFQNGIDRQDELKIEEVPVKVVDVINRPLKIKNETFIGETLSPVIITRPSPRKGGYSLHLTPDDESYSKMVLKNIFNKYSAYRGKMINMENNCAFSFYLPSVRVKIVPYKDMFFKTASGILALTILNKEILQFACLAGIGEKNSMGFGLVI